MNIDQRNGSLVPSVTSLVKKTENQNLQAKNSILRDLLKAKAHLGTQTWTNNMSKFLLGSRNGISIIHLEHTLICLKRVLQLLESINKDQENSVMRKKTFFMKKEMKTLSQEPFISKVEMEPSMCSMQMEPHILFVNTQSKYSELVKQAAIQSNQSYINDRWIGGTLTNWKQISESILLYNKFSIQFERFLMIHNIQIPLYQKAKKRYEGLQLSKNNKSSKYIPDIIILTNPDQNSIVIKEAQLFKIPVIGFADSNTNTFGIDYIIPGNNKSIYFMYFCLNLITITLQKTRKHIL